MLLAALYPASGRCGGIVAVLFSVCVFFGGHMKVGVQGRKAIPPQPDVEDLIREHNIEHYDINNYNLHGPPCSLDIQRDLHRKNNNHQPLYLIPSTNLFWLPNRDGRVLIPRGSTIELHCSSAFYNSKPNHTGNSLLLAESTNSLALTCVEDTLFKLNGKTFEFREFACQEPLKYTVERTTEHCGYSQDENMNPGSDGYSVMGRIYRIGYFISSHRFVETMRVCHDMTQLRTYYTQHLLVPANAHFEKAVKRLNFSTSGFFQGHNMNSLYSQKHQSKLLAALLGMSSDEFASANVTANTFLARGHLAAKSDMIYATQQRSTFTYLNAAPQWQSFNGGQWAAMEDAVRKFISQNALDVICYTGTWGTMELATRSGKTKLHLTVDQNGNGILAVPKIFYRVLVNRRKPKSGIALIGVNDPQANLSLIQEQYIVCSDVQGEVHWLRWIRNSAMNLRKGYMYACYVDEFARRIRHLPKHLLQVNELLIQ